MMRLWHDYKKLKSINNNNNNNELVFPYQRLMLYSTLERGCNTTVQSPFGLFTNMDLLKRKDTLIDLSKPKLPGRQYVV